LFGKFFEIAQEADLAGHLHNVNTIPEQTNLVKHYFREL
jgi:hypothetical protein